MNEGYAELFGRADGGDVDENSPDICEQKLANE